MKVVIIGGSLGGLGVANVLTRLGATVKVFERLSMGFEQKGAAMGFVDVDLWEELCGGATFMRRGQRAHRGQGAYAYQDLWRYLYNQLPEGTVVFDKHVADLGDDATELPAVDGETFDLAVVADGGWSTLRRKYVDAREPVYGGYQVFWGKVETKDIGGRRLDPHGYHETSGIYDSMILPVPMEDGRDFYMGGAFMATPEGHVRKPEAGANRHAGGKERAPGSQKTG